LSTVTIEDAKAHLAEIIEQLHPGEEIIITRDQKPIARLVGETKLQQAEAGIMEKLPNIRIDAPPDFASNLDLYVNGDKRIEDGTR
jgi:prevent-host-death family protein